jgi:hypothetical protein
MGLAAKAKAFQRPSKGHHWPQHGLNMAQQGLNTASTRPQHGHNMQNGKLAFLLKIS